MHYEIYLLFIKYQIQYYITLRQYIQHLTFKVRKTDYRYTDTCNNVWLWMTSSLAYSATSKVSLIQLLLYNLLIPINLCVWDSGLS